MGGRWEAYDRPDRAFAAWATNDDRTLVIAGWPYREFEATKKDLEGNYLQTLELAPLFAERLRRATRETRLVGAVVPNFFRKPYGPGWVLVGDAGYNKDFVTAQGIQDAFQDAELCATALHETFSGGRPFDAALTEYQSRRDERVLPMYEFTLEFAALEPPPSSGACLPPSTATRRRWTSSRGSTPGSSHRRTSSHRTTWNASWPQVSGHRVVPRLTAQSRSADRPVGSAADCPATPALSRSTTRTGCAVFERPALVRPVPSTWAAIVQASSLVRVLARLGCTRIGSPGIFG
jgi:hypothetical protein